MVNHLTKIFLFKVFLEYMPYHFHDFFLMCVQYNSEHVYQQAGEDKGQHDQITIPATY
jgi:hypothetical protein